MKKNLVLLLLLIIYSNSFSQANNFDVGNFSFTLNNAVLSALKDDSLIYIKNFVNPAIDSTDLDNDGINELEIIDSTNSSGQAFYTIYIYSTLDSFYLADSIYSGITMPYLAESEDVNGKIIVTGSPFFDHYNDESGTSFSPINCWNYESGEVFDVNDEVYDLFMDENDSIIDYLDNYFQLKEYNCTNSKEVLGAIVTAYTNYIHAGEESAAQQFFSTYYYCLDAENFKKELNSELKR